MTGFSGVSLGRIITTFLTSPSILCVICVGDQRGGKMAAMTPDFRGENYLPINQVYFGAGTVENFPPLRGSGKFSTFERKWKIFHP